MIKARNYTAKLPAVAMLSGLVALAFGAAPAAHASSISFNSNADITVQACAYGRGAAAIAQAEAQAAAELAAFVKGPALLQLNEVADSLTTTSAAEATQWVQSLQEASQSGITVANLFVQSGQPWLQGSDTCVSMTLVRGTDVGGADALDGEIVWDDASREVAVVVNGEGWPNKAKGLSAQQVAEVDGLRRAVSQVVGVWLQQNYSQYSNSSIEQTNDEVNESLKDVVAQQLHTRSNGLVKRWQLLDTQMLSDGGVKLTLEAVVEKQELAQAAQDILTAIGSPRVRVMAPQPLADHLRLWLNQQGIEVSENASLLVNANADVRVSGNSARLHLGVQVEDAAGNLYGQWNNNPALLALPNQTGIHRDLLDVHLSHEQQRAALANALHEAFTQMVAQGGLIHEIAIARRYLSSTAELPGVLQTIGGVRDVQVGGNEQLVTAQLRYNGSAAELASVLSQVLPPLLAAPLPQARIDNAYKIKFL